MYYFVVNPAARSGKGKAVFERLEQYLKENNIEYRAYFSKGVGNVQELVKDISSEHLDDATPCNLIIMGGDGTLNEALQGVVDFSRINIGYIPAGSGNDFARYFEYPDDPIEAFKHIRNVNIPRLIDLGRLKYENIESDEQIPESRLFAVSTGIGFDAEICEGVSRSKYKKVLNKLGVGKLIYVFVAIKLIFSEELNHTEIKLDADDSVTIYRMRFAAGMNTPFEGGGFMFSPKAVCDDGYLDVSTIGEASAWTVIKTFPAAKKGRHVKNKHVRIFHVKNYEVITDKPLYVHTDGEVHAKSNHIKVSVLPKKMRFLY